MIATIILPQEIGSYNLIRSAPFSPRFLPREPDDFVHGRWDDVTPMQIMEIVQFVESNGNRIIELSVMPTGG